MKYLQKRKAAFRYAGIGIVRLFREEPHAKIHLLAAICVVVAGIIFGISPGEWCLCLLCIGSVFTAEAFNTAIEKLADRVTRENDPLIATAKDVAAAGVLIAAIISVIVGLIIFLPKFLS